jgi:CRP/FNR family transcriptional regulator, cyclic AMP receptor protein
LNDTTTIGMVLGFIGVSLSLASCSMKNMAALRKVSIVCNIVFIAYGIIIAQLPTIVLNAVLLPINLWRLHQLRELVRNIEAAHSDSPLAEWLLPHMEKKHYAAGTLLFRKDDSAQQMYYIHAGDVRLIEIDKTLHAGELFGEIGLFTPTSLRTLSAECLTDCVMYEMSKDSAYKLYYQEPKLAFHLLNLIVARLIESKRLDQAAGRNYPERTAKPLNG